MAFVSITRLRLRSIRFLPGFALHAFTTTAQVRAAPGFQGGSLLNDRHWTFWTMTLWEDAAAMRAYMASGAHLKAMPKLMHWCDEASIVHWDDAVAALPDWAEADLRMREQGRASKLHHPSPRHADLRYAPPRLMRQVPIRAAAGH